MQIAEMGVAIVDYSTDVVGRASERTRTRWSHPLASTEVSTDKRLVGSDGTVTGVSDSQQCAQLHTLAFGMEVATLPTPLGHQVSRRTSQDLERSI